MNHKATVEAMYAAFSRGDVPAILEKLSPDIVWEDRDASTDVPWLRPRRGREGAIEFFKALASGYDIQKFEVRTILEGPGLVVVLLDVEGVVIATQKRIADRDGVHLWRFDADGLVSSFAHRIDTHRHHLAFTGRD